MRHPTLQSNLTPDSCTKPVVPWVNYNAPTPHLLVLTYISCRNWPHERLWEEEFKTLSTSLRRPSTHVTPQHRAISGACRGVITVARPVSTLSDDDQVACTAIDCQLLLSSRPKVPWSSGIDYDEVIKTSVNTFVLHDVTSPSCTIVLFGAITDSHAEQ